MAKKNTPTQVPGDSATVLGSPESTKLETAVSDTVAQTATKKTKDPLTSMFSSTGKISIKPFVDNRKENMGLEDYDFVVFPGIYHEEQLAAIERNGVVRYITGLDEFAPEVQNIKDPEKKQSVSTNIRILVAHLEKLLATNVLKVDDDDFWNKVKLLRPDNHDFWSKISLRVSNEPVHLEPTKNGKEKHTNSSSR